MIYFGEIAISLTTRLIFKHESGGKVSGLTSARSVVSRWRRWCELSGVGQLGDFWPAPKHKLWQHKYSFIFLIIWILSSDSLFSKFILEPTARGKWKATWGWLWSAAGSRIREHDCSCSQEDVYNTSKHTCQRVFQETAEQGQKEERNLKKTPWWFRKFFRRKFSFCVVLFHSL